MPEETDRPDLHPLAVLDALLKRPAQLTAQLQAAPLRRVLLTLAALALAGFALYGVVVGSFSGGRQVWAAPLKIAGGSALSALICLPSLYIFSCLGGADVRLASLCGVLTASLTLNALLLISFAPVAWIFSQSTDSVALMGVMHLIFWTVGLFFGVRLLFAYARHINVKDREYLRVWFVVFALVSLQMMTALRPIIGTAPTFLPTDKQFFLEHWVSCLR